MAAAAAISLFVCALDQTAKYWVLCLLSPGQSIVVVPGIFHFTLVFNQGAAFGLFKGGGFFFVAASLVSIIAIVLLLWRQAFCARIFSLDAKDKIFRLCLGLILGGALGNLIDRLRFSYVVDFLDFRVWPVFNLADSAITVGGFIIFCKMLRKTKHTEITNNR